MARQIGWALAAWIVIGGTPAAEASLCDLEQEHKPQSQRADRRDFREPFDNHPRYPWWKDDKALAAAGFSSEQAAEIDRIFKEAIERTRPLRDEVMQLQKALNEIIAANIADVTVFASQVDKIENKRAELNKARLVMLYRMHRVLTPEQNTKLLAYFERREAERRQQDGDRRK